MNGYRSREKSAFQKKRAQIKKTTFYPFQEVVLRRSLPSERLGLTLCYEVASPPEAAEAEAEAAAEAVGPDQEASIFVDDVHPEGVAARDGRLRLGDQIVQVCREHDSFENGGNVGCSDQICREKTYV